MSALVVGLGSIGLRHLENLRALGVGRLGALRRRGGPLCRPVDLTGVTMHRELEEALAAGYDLVVVANPTALHLEVALPAARAGCHLYLDKPVSHELAGLDELAREVDGRGLAVQVGCQLRFDPTLEAVQGWLAEGRPGKPLTAVAQVGEWLPGWHPWEDYRQGYAARADLGGGVALTLIHEIDYLLWLLGPLRVLAATGGVSGELELGVEDHLAALLRSRPGVGVCLTMDFLQRPAVRSLRLACGQGRIDWDYHAGLAELWLEGKLAERAERPPEWQRNDLYLAAMADFLEAVAAGRQPRIPLAQGVDALETALAIKARLDDGR
jgi:predicted dehydrogenase